MAHFAVRPISRLGSTIKPPPWTSDIGANVIRFALPFRRNTFLHSSALVAQAPVRSIALACPNGARIAPDSMITAKAFFGLTCIPFLLAAPGADSTIQIGPVQTGPRRGCRAAPGEGLI